MVQFGMVQERAVVLNIALKNILCSATVDGLMVDCLMVDGTKHPWLHHKEVAPVLLRLVYKGEVVFHFLGLHVLVKEGRRANVDGYMDVLQNTFFDHPELHRICVACVTDCSNVMSSAEGMNSDYLRPKKKHKCSPTVPVHTQRNRGTSTTIVTAEGNTSLPSHCFTVATV